ncbi:MAG: hypothetical protein IPM53_20950 [Anaerolineaceae bacterium]|nr:hypothetical protein [Anaerolineaceae bacterium]
MADFEDFLIAEFNELHNNMRQIETSMTQMIQGFFSIEGVVLAGALTLLSINVPTDQLVAIMAPIFWFLFLFGHITYSIAIYSFVNILVIDFQNTVARKYFGKKYGKEEYLYFMLNPEANSGGNHGEWEKVQDNRSATAKFVGVVLLIALGTSIYAVIKFAYPQLNYFAMIAANPLIVLVILVVTAIVIQRTYHRIVFLRAVRREERITLQRRQELLKRISHDMFSLEP